jgi:hypothetical protein
MNAMSRSSRMATDCDDNDRHRAACTGRGAALAAFGTEIIREASHEVARGSPALREGAWPQMPGPSAARLASS